MSRKPQQHLRFAGGVPAPRMPRNFGAPSQMLMHELASSPPWREALVALL